MSRVLYISYDGMLEPLGQSQVLGYLERLKEGAVIHLVSFEKPEDWAEEARREAVRARIAKAGIVWHPQRYHKRPTAPATGFDIARGTAIGAFLVRRHKLKIVHARSYVPATMALGIKRLTGARFLFDMRGFWADERVDGGLWPAHGRLYRAAKRMERRLLLNADAVVALTNAAATEIRSFDYLQERCPAITVIPTCADLDRFKPEVQAPRGPTSPFVLGYLGGAGTWYLFDEAIAFFRTLKGIAPNSRLMIVNRNEHGFIRERLEAGEVDFADVDIVSGTHAEVPRLIRRMSAGIVLIKPVYSKMASAPTKLAEFLGCGVPCVANVGVGDMQSIIEDGRCGVILETLDDRGRKRAAADLFALVQASATQGRCVGTARMHFSLDMGVERYRSLYEKLSKRSASVEQVGGPLAR